MNDLALERAVIGACIRDGEVFDAVAKIVRRAEVFFTYAHQIAWRGMVAMSAESLPFDAVTLFDTLLKQKASGDCKAEYLVSLWSNAPSTSVLHHAKTLVELFLRREIAAELTKGTDEVADPSSPPLVLVERIKKQLEALSSIAYHVDDDDDQAGDKWKPFPLEHLPSSLRAFVEHAAAALHCDPAFIAIPALVTVAGAIGNSRVITIKETWQEPAIVWASVVADSSSLKSPSMDLACSPLWALQRGMSTEYEELYQRWRTANEEWNKARFSKGGGGDGADPSSAPPKPKPRKILVNDITVEKLAHVMWENPQGVTLLRDELSGWFGSFGRYSDGKGPGADMANWLSIFRAGSMIVDRRSGEPPTINIPRAACSVYGTIQPRILKRILTEDFFDSGLASRLLFCMPPRKPKIWTDAIVPEEVYSLYSSAIKDIYETGIETLEANSNSPYPVPFNKAGKAAWIEFYQEWADRQSHAEGELGYALAKLEGYCARFALLLCVYEKATNPFRREEVTEGQVKRAFGITTWFANEIERVYRMVRTPEEEHRKNRLVEFILGHEGEMTPSRLAKSNPSKYETADDAEKALNKLVDGGQGSWVMKLAGKQGGRPSRVFKLKPPKT